ncbi:YbaB/EbfC family nucleoid-associated protein [Myxococcota bacterium]|nr:YbaB/EbfC family nucleoid-associated protein [Myxococcota bacterium]MBU1242242.1 YbaB/EbfC family nucleoid-associated protein [Myxococcota bacterium]MBU1411695.1 YbaB/EbfC family nucleoid-associated protein [Myxococcota bacterium]MBU1511072.1 YbaB/EbfC family nucleoid-associated protein [Myxococcota bacterium]
MTTPMDFSSLGSFLPGLNELPAKLEKMQKRTASEVVTAETGGGMVTIEATANMRIRRITLSKSLTDLSDPEMTEDLLAACFNLVIDRCREKSQAIAAEELGPMASFLQNNPLF